MKAWATLFNFFGALMLIYIIMIMHHDIRDNERQFEELKLRYAIDYATEGAFLASLEGGNLGISYQDLQNVTINPSNTLPVFKNIMAMSYDMSLSRANMDALDQYISGAVIAIADGYYIASLEEVDTPNQQGRGGEYQLKWGLKKPYTIQHGIDRYVAYNLSSEKWALAEQSGATLNLRRGETWAELTTLEGIAPNRQNITTQINKLITRDINYNINKRNNIYNTETKKDFIYLPSQQTQSGVNSITKPSIFITMSGVDFAGSQKLEAKSVGGFTIAKKRRVLGFTDGGIKYYAYETQLPPAKVALVEQFYNTVDEAALAGYRPHVDYLRNRITTDAP